MGPCGYLSMYLLLWSALAYAHMYAGTRMCRCRSQKILSALLYHSPSYALDTGSLTGAGLEASEGTSIERMPL